ncbi:uncharacterized protein PV07_10257 [Cladophialophora immunda]|uniref:Peptidase S8/S53 domain-containing protein n=1 Tax=Cladophialophora immunda TaxID=569365 RepID=A0A0D2BZP5_9EURO|nr:uncharacterized protein PV07_10257 [Cladophialophora immunda]KIW24548.1 hypothetical protein PV07_10257 [Cladophialophora immunda]
MAAEGTRRIRTARLRKLLLKLAWTIATAIQTLPNQTDQLRNLKILLISPLWTSLENPDIENVLSLNISISGCLEEVAESLEILFGGDRESNLKTQDSLENSLPMLLELEKRCDTTFGGELVREKLSMSPTVEDTKSFLINCIGKLEKWNSVSKISSGHHIDHPSDDPNPATIVHPLPKIEYAVFEGSNSTHHLTDLLHDVLHANWPCQIGDHNHAGRLGECEEARFCLDSRWSFSKTIDYFSIVLSGQGVLQECKFCILANSLRPKGTKQEMCLTVHSSMRDYCLNLAMTDTTGLWIRWKQSPTLFESHSISRCREMTLRELLGTVTLTICARRVIGLVLARAALHLLGGKWASSPLSLDNIILYHTIVDGRPLFYFDKIFVSTRFSEPGPGSTQSYDDVPVSPLYGIHDLAVVLAKIELGENLARVEEKIGLALEANPLALGKSLLKQCRLYSSSPPSTIEFCLDPSSFDDFEDLDQEELLVNRDFINAYYKGVIRPLEGWLIKYGWTWKQVNWHQPYVMDHNGICHFVQHAKSGEPFGKTQTLKIRENTRPTLSIDPVRETNNDLQIEWSGQPPGSVMDYGSLSSTVTYDRADNWFVNLKRMLGNIYRDSLLTSSKTEELKYPKVAIIDTGIYLGHPELQPFVNSGHIAGWHDFVLGNESNEDLDGHGTHVSHLLLKTAPYLRLYHARAFRHSDADADTATLVARAIRHAVDKWNVDIISMSFAFEELDVGILNAIHHAVDCGVLLFAAASNNRAERRNPIGYPAREENVICVNSTDDQGNKSTFSPEGVERDYNFAVLGENLEAAWPPTQNNGQNLKRVTGTSQATPLVAGIAAIILHVTRMKQFGKFDMETLLKQARGMRKVLYECMTKKQGAPRYNYITPGDLFNSKLSSIRVKIESALENL